MDKKNKIEMNTFKSADGITDVAYYIFTNSNVKPKAILQISHGMQEYIGRYEKFAEFMCEQGFVVCGNDHLGHGKTSESGEKIKGYMGEKNGYIFVVKDLHTMTQIIKDKYPKLPIFLFGHSMGSFYARFYAELYGNDVDGIIISGTGGPNPISGIGMALVKTLGKINGFKNTSPFFEKIVFGKYNDRVDNPQTGAEWITRNQAVIEKYAQDPNCTFKFTLGGYKDLIQIQSLVNKKSWAEKVPKDMPIYIVSGAEDPVGDYGKGVTKVYDMLREAGLKDVKMKLYDGCRHEVHNEIEPSRQMFLDDLVKWMNERI